MELFIPGNRGSYEGDRRFVSTRGGYQGEYPHAQTLLPSFRLEDWLTAAEIAVPIVLWSIGKVTDRPLLSKMGKIAGAVAGTELVARFFKPSITRIED